MVVMGPSAVHYEAGTEKSKIIFTGENVFLLTFHPFWLESLSTENYFPSSSGKIVWAFDFFIRKVTKMLSPFVNSFRKS